MSWFIRRIATSIMVFLAALAINFAIPRLMPGNPVDVIAGGVKITRAAREALIQQFGLNAPIGEQFWRYFTGVFQGDLGVSFYYFPTPVWDVVMHALPWTLLIVGSAFIIQPVIGYFAGVTAGWKPGSKTDSTLQTSSLAILSAPIFWVGMIFLFVFAFQLKWSPLGGCSTAAAEYSSIFEQMVDIMKHAALPIIVFTLARFATYQLILRNTMVTTLKEQYILTAEAKGLSKNRVKYRHAARNALLPMVTLLGINFAVLTSDSIYVEAVFSYPGLGLLTYSSVLIRDYPVLQGCFLIFTIIVIVGNFFADIFYMYLDPRIRY